MNEVEGWVKVHRELIKSRVFRNEGLLKVWIWCLLKANHKGRWVAITTGRGKTEVWIDAGQFIFGRYKAADELNMKPTTVWKRIGKLKVLSQITLKSDTHYTIITIVNWNSYQGVILKSDNQVSTKCQPSDTNKNDKNDKKDLMSFQNKNNGIPHKEIIDLYHTILPELPRVKVFTKKRNSMLNARWFEDTKRQSLDWWDGYFKHVRESKFLMGDNKGVWQANFEWLITSSKLTNVIEGVYHH